MDGLQMYAVLYSKFSQASQRFLALLENIPKLRTQATLLCIDNRQVRQRVMSNPKLPVQEVPCVIRIFADTGYTELFEGEQAFALVKGFMLDTQASVASVASAASVASVASQVPVASQAPPVIIAAPPPEVTALPGPKLPSQMSLKQHMALVDMPTLQSLQTQPAPGSPVGVGSPPQNGVIQEGNFIQISKNPTFEEIPSMPAPPAGTAPVAAQLNASYLNEIEKENMQRGVPERSLKSNMNSGGNLITRAQQMQKEREAEMGMSEPRMRPV